MKGKFLDDVRAARRIFIYSSLTPRPVEQVDALFDALGRFGSNRLIFVREADADLPVSDDDRPTACMSGNYHLDNFRRALALD